MTLNEEGDTDIFERRFYTYSSISKFSQNLWKREVRGKRPLCMYVIGMPIFWHTIMSYKRGLFALFILFPGNARSLLMGWLQRKLPRFSCMFIFILIAWFGEFLWHIFFTMKPIGILIKEELERQERSISWFARKLSCDRSNVYRLFQKENVDTGLLTRISLLLNHDFFADLSEKIKENH